jgi:hypothetical protein
LICFLSEKLELELALKKLARNGSFWDVEGHNFIPRKSAANGAL